jgi:hypothetical protein
MTYDQKGQHGIIVLKRGRTTDLTVGRASNIFSYTRNYFGCDQISKEWVILSFNPKSGPFSEKGDSGSVIVDGTGRIGGILTGGIGIGDSVDLTYATPASFVLKVIRSNDVLAKASPSEGPAS